MSEQFISVTADRDSRYYVDREMTSSIIEFDGCYKAWYKNNKLHRENGPAVEHFNGDKAWYLNGKLHREDGPAVEYVNGNKAWYLNGESITRENHKIITRLERQKSLFTIEEIAQYINGWVTGPFDNVHEIGKGTLLTALSQLECEQDGIVAFFNRRKGTAL